MKILFVLLMVPFVGTSYAQPVYELGPDECVRLGLEQNRSLRAVRQEAVEATSVYHETRTRRLPVLSARGSYQRLSGNIPDFAVDFPSLPGTGSPAEGIFEVPAILNRYDFRLQVEQPLFTGGRVHYGIQAAESQAEAALQKVAATESDLAYAIREAYWDLVEAHAVQEAVHAALKQIEVHLQDVRNLYAQGMALQSDVLAVETRQAEVHLQQVEAENALRLARLALNYRMGLPLDAEVRPSGRVQVEVLTEPVDMLVERAWQNRADLRAGAYEVQALEAGVDAAQAGWFPQVYAVGTYSYARPNPYVFPQEDAFTGTWEAGVTVTMDLWNWGRTRDRIRQARARATRAEEQLEDLREVVRLEVMQQVLALERATAAVEVTRQGLRAAEEAYRVMRERGRQGMALTAEVLDAEAAYRRAEMQHAAALADYGIARAALRRATGEPTTE